MVLSPSSPTTNTSPPCKRHLDPCDTSTVNANRISPKNSPKKCARASDVPQTALEPGWNFFIPLQTVNTPFTLPVERIKATLHQIKTSEPKLGLPEKLITKIVELAHILHPHTYVQYKKNTTLENLENGSVTNFPVSFLVAAIPGNVYVCISKKVIIDKTENRTVKYAIGLAFQKVGEAWHYSGALDTVKHALSIVKGQDHKQYAKELQNAQRRILLASVLHETPHIVLPYFLSSVRKVDGIKLIMMASRYTESLFAYFNSFPPLPSEIKKTTLLIAEHLILALKGMHDKGFTHRDVKDENVLARWDTAGKLETVDLNDFENCSTMKPDDPTTRFFCGTLQYNAPEMLAYGLDYQAIFKALGVKDPQELFGPALDTWGYGVLLHYAYYRTFPKDVDHLNRYVFCKKQLEEPECPEAIPFYTKEANESLQCWQECVLSKIEEEKKTEIIPQQLSIETFIDSLLRMDPRNRPPDDKILDMVQKLKLLFCPSSFMS